MFFFEMRKPATEARDFMLKHCKDARWDLVARVIKIMEEGFKKKIDKEINNVITGMF